MKYTTLRWFVGSALLTAACFVLAGASAAQTLKADYQFQGNLNSSVGTAPALTNLVGAGNGQNSYGMDMVDGFPRQVLNFPGNNGVALNSLSGVVTDTSFTAVILFKMNIITGRRRLFDSSGGTQADQGGFLLDGRIEGENPSTIPITTSTYVQIIMIRGGGTIKAYRDGTLRVTQPDDGSPLANGLRFFQDYVNNPIQASGGSIARLRFYDAPMTDDQVAGIDRVPESVSGPMPLLTSSNRNGYPNNFRMNADGTSQKRLTSGNAIAANGRFSPDGQKIVYHGRANLSVPLSIWISNADGSNPVQLTNTSAMDRLPSWRPDGQKIIFSRCGSQSCDLYTMNPDGTGVEPLTAANTSNAEDDPRYTPDGTKIAFICAVGTNNLQLCTANADGTNRMQITNAPGPIQHFSLDISPDGTKIVCIKGTDPSTNRITIMNFDGSGIVQLPQNNNVGSPIWSPDGTKLAYSWISFGDTREIHVANIDGTAETRITFNSADDAVSDWYRPQTANRVFGDFDGDGKTDLSIFRPSNGQWWWTRSGTGITMATTFGLSTDIITPADFTGDGKTDHALFRPSTGEWFVLRSEDFTYYAAPFGTAGDVPVPGRFDADAKADIAIFRPSNSTWYVINSAGGTTIQQFGAAGDVPVAADYDGDGRSDIAIYRPSVGQWWIQRSSAGLIAYQFGSSTDRIVPADYTGDGKADAAVWRPSTGEWFVLRSENATFYAFGFGSNGDLPVPGDYDGDGKSDAGLFRPSTGTWYLNRSTAGVAIHQFGGNGDQPIPNAFVR